jgi:hypothetical protein
MSVIRILSSCFGFKTQVKFPEPLPLALAAPSAAVLLQDKPSIISCIVRSKLLILNRCNQDEKMKSVWHEAYFLHILESRYVE